MSSRNTGAAAPVASVALVILLGLVVGALGLVAADLYAVGVLILFLGGIGAAVLIGEQLIRYISSRQPPT
jgi:type IV secretory pathway TrbD component